MSEPTDGQLVARTLYGDEKAFEVIVRRHQKLVYNVLFTMLHDHGLAADAMQDTFLKAYRALPSFRIESELRPWLLQIATNTALNMIRRHKSQAAQSLDEVLEENPLNEPVSDASTELEVERKLEMATVRDALGELPVRQRQIFVLRYQHDLSYADIATVLGETASAVKTQLFRAREKLRKLLCQEVSN
jgi:RNA polymerase sigma-70 factor (ECF subfamily)